MSEHQRSTHSSARTSELEHQSSTAVSGSRVRIMEPSATSEGPSSGPSAPPEAPSAPHAAVEQPPLSLPLPEGITPGEAFLHVAAPPAAEGDLEY